MKKTNIKTTLPLAAFLALAIIPIAMADDNLGVTVEVGTPHILPFTAQVLIATGLGFPVLLFSLLLLKAKDYKDVAWILVAILISLTIIAGITQSLFV